LGADHVWTVFVGAARVVEFPVVVALELVELIPGVLPFFQRGGLQRPVSASGGRGCRVWVPYILHSGSEYLLPLLDLSAVLALRLREAIPERQNALDET
jgi:hypothetical protein